MSERALEYSWITRKDRKTKCALHVNGDSVVSRVECRSSVSERASEYSRILPGKGDVDDIFGKQSVVAQSLTKKGGEKTTTKNKQGRKTRKRKSYCLRKDLHKLP